LDGLGARYALGPFLFSAACGSLRRPDDALSHPPGWL